MKNQIVKLLPLCLLCWIFFSGCQAAFSTGSPVSCTMQLPSGGQVEWKDGALMKQMSDLLASVRPEETLSFPEEQSYQLTFYQEDGTSVSFSLAFDRDQMLVQNAAGQIGFCPNVQEGKRLLSDSSLDEGYDFSPEVAFFLGQEEITQQFACSGAMVFTRPDGTTLEKGFSEQSQQTLVVDSQEQLFSLSFEDEPSKVLVTLSQGASILFEGTPEELSQYLPNQNGEYLLTIETVWEGDGMKIPSGSLEYTVAVSYQLPPSVTLVSDQVAQGDVVTFYVRNEDNQVLTVVSDLNHPVHQFVEEGATVILIPTSYMTATGIYQVEITGETIQEQYAIEVTATQFPEQRLYVEESLTSETVDSDDANQEYNLAAQRAKETFDQQQYWSEPFLQPVEGEVTAEYGMTRYVNDVPSTRHAAVDLAAEENTPVAASNSGRIVLAEYLQLTGNTVVIEHGYGIKTWYYHMNQLEVQEGDMVERGDTIGLVGSTGFSTGPHLHFAVTVNNIYVSPWFVLENKLVDTQYRSN